MDKELPVSAWPEWKIIEKIGEGSFGKVYKAQRTERGKSFYSAIKIINIPGSQSELNSVRSETGDEQSTRQYFQNLVEECIQEISTMEYFRGNSYIVSVEDFKVMEYLDVIGWEISIRMEYLTSFMDYCAEKQLTEKEVIKLGMYIGFTGVLTFKNAKKALRALEAVPLDRLLLETDCPYMAPEPLRGRRCDSSMICYTAEKTAQIKGVSTQELLDITCRNGMDFYHIPH